MQNAQLCAPLAAENSSQRPIQIGSLGGNSDRVPVTERNAAIVTSSICGGRTRGYCACNPRRDEFDPGGWSLPVRAVYPGSQRAHPCRATRWGMCGVHGVYDFAVFCLSGQPPVWPLLPLLPILLSLILPLGSCILILLAHPLDQCTSERARVNQDHLEVNVAVMAAVAKGYDLDYAWRALGEAYQGTAAAAWSCRDLK